MPGPDISPAYTYTYNTPITPGVMEWQAFVDLYGPIDFGPCAPGQSGWTYGLPATGGNGVTIALPNVGAAPDLPAGWGSLNVVVGVQPFTDINWNCPCGANCTTSVTTWTIDLFGPNPSPQSAEGAYTDPPATFTGVANAAGAGWRFEAGVPLAAPPFTPASPWPAGAYIKVRASGQHTSLAIIVDAKVNLPLPPSPTQRPLPFLPLTPLPPIPPPCPLATPTGTISAGAATSGIVRR